jgi:uncharacterized DUF497 family protein
MVFAFDEQKSSANRAKHGIDFVEAQRLWSDPHRIEYPGRDVGEPRWLVTGLIEGRLWTACITYREQKIRIISTRRARPHEADRYQQAHSSSS